MSVEVGPSTGHLTVMKHMIKTAFIDKILKYKVKMLNHNWDYILSHQIQGWPEKVPRLDHESWDQTHLDALAMNMNGIKFQIKNTIGKARPIKKNSRAENINIKQLLKKRVKIEDYFKNLLKKKLGFDIQYLNWNLIDLDYLINYPFNHISNLENAQDILKLYGIIKSDNPVLLKDDEELISQLDEEIRYDMILQKIMDKLGIPFADFGLIDLPWIEPSKHILGLPITDRKVIMDIEEFINSLDPKDFGNLEFTDEYWEKLRKELLD